MLLEGAIRFGHSATANHDCRCKWIGNGFPVPQCRGKVVRVSVTHNFKHSSRFDVPGTILQHHVDGMWVWSRPDGMWVWSRPGSRTVVLGVNVVLGANVGRGMVGCRRVVGGAGSWCTVHWCCGTVRRRRRCEFSFGEKFRFRSIFSAYF